MQYTDDGLEAIIFTAQGDMRQVRAAAAPPPGLATPLVLRGEGGDCCTRTKIDQGTLTRHIGGGLGPRGSRPARKGLNMDSQEESGGGQRLSRPPGRVSVPWQALNNLQSTYSGFGFINSENVFKVRAGVAISHQGRVYLPGRWNCPAFT